MKKLFLIYIFFISLLAAAGETNNISSKLYTNGNVISELKFSELKKNKVYILKSVDRKDTVLTNIDFYNIVHQLVLQTNQDLIAKLAEEFAIKNYTNKPMAVLRAAVLKELTAYKGRKHKILSESLIKMNLTGNLILRNADMIESMQIEQGDRKEQMIYIRGKVEIIYEKSVIYANKIVFNTHTHNFYGEGDLRIVSSDMDLIGKKAFLSSKQRKGIIYNVKGIMENEMRIKGDASRINTDEHITVENGVLTLCTNRNPYFFLQSRRVEYTGEDTYIASVPRFLIHNFPFFAFPFHMQDPVSTGITMKFGHGVHEGYFIKNNFTFNFPVIGKIDTDFNIFEKLGTIFKFNNNFKTKAGKFSSDINLSRYFNNSYFTGLGGNTNSVYNGTFYRDKEFRYSLDFNYRLDLVKLKEDSGSDFSSIVTFSADKQSDPFFPDYDFNHNWQGEFDYLEFIQGKRIGKKFSSSPSREKYRDQIKLGMSERYKGTGVDLNAVWKYEAYAKDGRSTSKDHKDWETHLQEKIFPRINFSHSGTIDPRDKKKKRPFFLALNYDFNLGFSSREKYQNQEPYHYEYDKSKVNFATGINRSFRFLSNSHTGYFTAADFTFNPSLNINYNKAWGGENAEPTLIQAHKKETYLKYNFRSALSINFPSTHTRNKLNSSYGYLPMIPVLDFKMSYTIAKKNSKEDDDEIDLSFKNDDNFPDFVKHSVNASADLKHKGYGLFFIDHLDYILRSGLSFQYNLMPEYEISDDGTSNRLRGKDFHGEAKEEYYIDRIKKFNGNLSWNLTYRDFKMNYNLNYDLVNDKKHQFYNTFKKCLYKNNLSLSYNFKNKRRDNPWFSLRSLSTGFSWNYYFREENYLADRMGFNLNFVLNFLKYFTLSFSIASSAPAYHYVKHKAAYLVAKYDDPARYGYRNFFVDLQKAFGIVGTSSRVDKVSGENWWERRKKVSQDFKEEAYFDLNASGMTIVLKHDLDTWDMRLMYTVQPNSVTGLPDIGALKGYYFKRKIEVEVNIKPGLRDKINMEEDTFPAHEKDYSPPGFRNNE